MSINIIKCLPTIVEGSMIFKKNNILEPCSVSPLIWNHDVKSIVIRNRNGDFIKTLENMRDSKDSAIYIPSSNYSLFINSDLTSDYDRYFELELHLGFGFLRTTNKAGDGYYFGGKGIAEAILSNAFDKVKGFLLGELSDVSGAVNDLFENFCENTGTPPENGELVFLITPNPCDTMLSENCYTYSSKVTELEVEMGVQPEGVEFFIDKFNELNGVKLSFKTILTNYLNK